MNQPTAVSVFFRNDKPNGIGIYQEVTADWWKAVNTLLEGCEAAWAKALDKDVEAKYCLDQLEQWGHDLRSGKMTNDDLDALAALAMGNLHVLIRNGYLIQDEYNGIVYHNGEKIVKIVSLRGRGN